MDSETFEKVLQYLELDPNDRRALALEALFVHRVTRSDAARAYGMSPASVGLVLDRALRDLRRAGDLTGVYIEPVIKRGMPGRRTAVNQSSIPKSADSAVY